VCPETLARPAAVILVLQGEETHNLDLAAVEKRNLRKQLIAQGYSMEVRAERMG